MQNKMESNAFFPDELLRQMRRQADPVADELVAALMQTGDRQALHGWWDSVAVNGEPLPHGLPDTVKYYLSETQNPPAWADRRRMQRGHAFFARHAAPILSILGCLSLPYCYAAADGAQVLWLSQRIRHDTRRRLAETARFLLDVMAPEAFEPRGKGIRSIQKVRLIHAVARHYAGHSENWDDAWGVPVNQEDMAGTNLAFSYIVLQGLQKLNVQWSKPEAEDFLHLWNVIGTMLGLDERLLPNDLQAAYWLDRKIVARHFRRSEAGTGLTKALLQSLYELNESTVTQAFADAYMRYLLGDAVADLLEVPPANGAKPLVSAFKTVNLLSSFATGFSAVKPEKVAATLQNQLKKQQAAADFPVPKAFG